MVIFNTFKFWEFTQLRFDQVNWFPSRSRNLFFYFRFKSVLVQVLNFSPSFVCFQSTTQDLFELLERVQSSRLDDQRCVLPAYFKVSTFFHFSTRMLFFLFFFLFSLCGCLSVFVQTADKRKNHLIHYGNWLWPNSVYRNVWC